MIGATLLDRYQIESELGKGGMGVVYKARDTLLNRAVAIKFLNTAGVGTEGKSRLLQEARATAQLNHPNIVSIYDVGEAGDSSFIVMELVKGDTLRKTEKPVLLEALLMARQICLALEHAHSNGIIHRDLKLENIVITNTQTLKLMDFGLARTADDVRMTEEGGITGTLAYLAPELIQGDPASIQSDLYAFGVILYELFAGQSPFQGTINVILAQHLQGKVAPPSKHNADIPTWLDDLILRLLSKRPEERPASAKDVLLVLEQSSAAPAADENPSLLGRIVRGKLAGRERELAEANLCWQRMIAGEGQALLVSGEPGVGKTRFTKEITTQAKSSGAIVLSGECYAEGGTPYAPIAQVIQQAFTLAPDLPEALPAYIFANLLSLAPALRIQYADNLPMVNQSEPEQIYDSVVELCMRLALDAPLVLFVDDLHWADAGTLALLRHLARRSQKNKLRLLIMATYREVELGEARALHEVLLDLNRERLATRIKIARLSKEWTGDMLALMFAEEIAPEFLDSIFQETEGNPFFIEEVCKSLVETGKLVFADGRWNRPNMNEIEIPQSLRLVIEARMSRLSALAQEALAMAATIGREFDFETLLRSSDQSEDALIESLEAAARAQIIEEIKGKGAERYSFVHALIPSTLYEGVSGRRRKRAHERIANAIEALRPNDFDGLAYHFAAADNAEKTVEYSRRAAEQAKSLYAYDAAIRHLRVALDFVESDQPELRRELLEELADAHSRLYAGAQAIPLYQEAIALWHGSRAATLRLYRKTIESAANTHRWADIQHLEAVLDESEQTALKLVEDQPPDAEAVRLFTAIATGILEKPAPQQDWDSAERFARRAVELAEQLDSPMEICYALDALNNVHATRGLFHEGVQIALRRLALSQDPRFDDQHERVNTLNRAGLALVNAGEYIQAMPHLLEAERLAAQAQNLNQQFDSLRFQSFCHYQMDQWDQVIKIEGKWRALEKRYPNLFKLISSHCFQLGLNASVRARRGEFEQAALLRDESRNVMLNQFGPQDEWGRGMYY
jgi:predicted ATPase/predicted Ser/Thr protein kinase